MPRLRMRLCCEIVVQAWQKWVIRLDTSGSKPGALGFISTFLFAGALAVLRTMWQFVIDCLEQHFQKSFFGVNEKMAGSAENGAGEESAFRIGKVVDLAKRLRKAALEIRATRLPQPRSSGLDWCCRGLEFRL